MAKKKSKKKSPAKHTQAKPAAPQPLTNKDKTDIEVKKNELASSKVKPIQKLSLESEKTLAETEKKEDIKTYWNYLKDINKRLETLEEEAKIFIAKTKKDNQSVEDEKKVIAANKEEVKAEQVELKERNEKCNERDRDITERESKLNLGDYTDVIKKLLDRIKETEKEVFMATENQLKELSEFHQKNLDEFSKHLIDNAEFQKNQKEFEKKEIKLKADLDVFKREKIAFKEEKEIIKEDIEAEFETKFSEKIENQKRRISRLQDKQSSLQEKKQKQEELLEKYQSAFESEDIEEITKKYTHINSELQKLQDELNERPEQYELDSQQEKIEELKGYNEELKSKINQKELLELKAIFHNEDSYIIENNAKNSEIESFKLREISLNKTNEDLLSTINTLKGESNKDEFPFEFATRCDNDKNNLGRNYLELAEKYPRDLNELVNYVQQKMAYQEDESFYYELDTIRIFLAGMHMSPISILQGISGTGKTSLPREFAKALISNGDYIGIDDNKENKASYRICAIQSGWRDNMDLMGYYNSFENKYKETDFFKALYTASQAKYSDTLFLIILDEMNLSRPEHYFADYLSLLEQSDAEQYIGFSNTPQKALPALIKGGKLKIPNNVRFIGTANHDETTLEFAPKTYDRSNVMEMPKNHPGENGINQVNNQYNVTYSWLNKQFLDAESKYNKECKSFIEFTSGLETLLLKDKGIGVGNRLEKQGERFISVYLHSGVEKERKADLAIAADHLITSRLFRTLKNRYDLEKDNLSSFKKDYVDLFKKMFEYEPKFASDLLDDEIKKK